MSKPAVSKDPETERLVLRINLRMVQLGITNAELARRLGVHRSAITHWLKLTNGPYRTRLPAIAEQLETSVGWLLGSGEDPDHVRDLDKFLKTIKGTDRSVADALAELDRTELEAMVARAVSKKRRKGL